MKTKMKTTTTSLAAALLTTVACAGQDRPQGPPPHRPMPLFEALDADGDRTISGAEIEAAVAALKGLDGDADGTITREELRPKPPGGAPAAPKDESYEAVPPVVAPPAGEDGQGAMPRRPKHPMPSPLMATMDRNRDGKLSTEEVSQAPESLAKLDRNEDGELSPRELHPPRPPKDNEEQEEAPRGPAGGQPGRNGPPPEGR